MITTLPPSHPLQPFCRAVTAAPEYRATRARAQPRTFSPPPLHILNFWSKVPQSPTKQLINHARGSILSVFYGNGVKCFAIMDFVLLIYVTQLVMIMINQSHIL
jgi:hypothetical protein